MDTWVTCVEGCPDKEFSELKLEDLDFSHQEEVFQTCLKTESQKLPISLAGPHGVALRARFPYVGLWSDLVVKALPNKTIGVTKLCFHLGCHQLETEERDEDKAVLRRHILSNVKFPE